MKCSLKIDGVRIAVSTLSSLCKPSTPRASKQFFHTRELELLTAKISKILQIKSTDIFSCKVIKRSIDARKKKQICFVYSAVVELIATPDEQHSAQSAKSIARYTSQAARAHCNVVPYAAPQPLTVPHLHSLPAEIVVVGAGCAGIFSALYLAEAGLRPLLIEQGPRPQERLRDVEHFLATGELNLASNIQFGCGGAGTFSDGKLATQTKSAWHTYIKEAFVQAGASRDILIDAKPHIGSDVLPHVVENLLARIEGQGGTVLTHTQLIDIETSKAPSLSCAQPLHLRALVVENPHGRLERIPCKRCILATGHSARSLYRLLPARFVACEPKTFAVGYRIEHLQEALNKSLYGKEWDNPLLGAAPYKVVARAKTGRSVFSFCMCPGGEVVAAASEKQQVVTNGASKHNRAAKNANAALLVNVTPRDAIDAVSADQDPLFAGLALQEEAEKRAYSAGGGLYRAPAQLVGDYLDSRPSHESGHIRPTYGRGVSFTDLHGLFPRYVDETIKACWPQLVHKLAFFADKEAVLTGVETRSSAPVRIVRDASYQSCSVAGLYPAGEGAGYAGGIMSAAADGLSSASALIDVVCEQPTN